MGVCVAISCYICVYDWRTYLLLCNLFHECVMIAIQEMNGNKKLVVSEIMHNCCRNV